MPLLNTNDATNALTVDEAGDYEISYNVDLTGTAEQTYQVTARQNTNNITQSITQNTSMVTTTGGGSWNASFTNSCIVTLSASDSIDLAITTTVAPSGTTTVQANGSCVLVVKKLND